MSKISSPRAGSVVPILAMAAALMCSPAAVAHGASTNELAFDSHLAAAPASWLTSDGVLVAFGSGSEWHLLRPDGTKIASGFLPRGIRSGALAGRRLYFDQGDAIGVIEVESGKASLQELRLPLQPGADRLLTRALDHLVVWEQGIGLRVARLPPPVGHAPPPDHEHCAWPVAVTPSGFLAVETPSTALASSGGTIYAALISNEIAVFSLDEDGVPHPAGSIPWAGPVRALALNGERMFVLGDRDLRVLDLSTANAASQSAVVYPDLTGNALAVSGRSVVVARPGVGLAAYREPSITAVTHVVTLTNFEFTPAEITIDAGDTVQWNNNQGLHNVNSCNVGETGCSANSAEIFGSGAAENAPWNFSHTFVQPGSNPYTCTVHAGFGMVGSVVVNPSATTPPGVPDGQAGTLPLTVRKTVASGATLEVSFDDASCQGGAGTQIVGGGQADLPTAPGGTYGVSLSRCACGTTSPCTWNSVPLPSPGQMIWFVLVARDAATTEGSWGTDNAGRERQGPGTGGSSSACGAIGKDVSNRCGI